MRKFLSILGVVLLPLGGCAPGEYLYANSASGYAPDYAPGYAPAYGYGYAEPSYPQPPFFGSGFQFEFGGRRDRHHRHHEHDWDGGD